MNIISESCFDTECIAVLLTYINASVAVLMIWYCELIQCQMREMSKDNIQVDNLYTEGEQWVQNLGEKTVHAKRMGGKFR